MISYEHSLQILRSIGLPVEPKPVHLGQLSGTTTSQDVHSPIDVPSFRNSSMDGFAVCVSSIADATSEHPVELDVLRTIAAGDDPSIGEAGKICEIMTGAPVPEPYDAVVPVEDVTITGSSGGLATRVQFSRCANKSQNIREPGEDFRKGQMIIPAKVTLNEGHIMSLASLGLHTLSVRSTPPLYLFSTGKEVTDRYDEPLAAGQIYNSNAPYRLACAREEKIQAHYGGVIADEVPAFHRALDSVPAGSMIITTGAVSKGRWDFIPDALKERGATIHFHRVNIRPGKPVLFATLKDGSFYFGLPGNPISTAIGYRFFVTPLIDSLVDRKPEKVLYAQLENAYSTKGALRHFLKSRVRIGRDGILRAHISNAQESFKIHPMATCNAWVIAEENQNELKLGMAVPVVPFTRRLAIDSMADIG
ncbi:MAG: molybdopterin molybdotransferase MoeA [Schlesneria sp.]